MNLGNQAEWKQKSQAGLLRPVWTCSYLGLTRLVSPYLVEDLRTCLRHCWMSGILNRYRVIFYRLPGLSKLRSSIRSEWETGIGLFVLSLLD